MLAAVFVLFGAVRASAGDSITLRWDPNPPEQGVLGYHVFVGAEYGEYVEFYDVGNQTFFVYPNAVPSQEYFFAVEAYNAVGNSPRSEVSGFSTPSALAVSATTVNPGDPITVTVANGPANVFDWVALALTSAADSNYLSWK